MMLARSAPSRSPTVPSVWTIWASMVSAGTRIRLAASPATTWSNAMARRNAWSACARASALPRTSAIRLSWSITSGGQDLSSRTVPSMSQPTGTPPMTSGRLAIDRIPTRSRKARSRSASTGRSSGLAIQIGRPVSEAVGDPRETGLRVKRLQRRAPGPGPSVSDAKGTTVGRRPGQGADDRHRRTRPPGRPGRPAGCRWRRPGIRSAPPRVDPGAHRTEAARPPSRGPGQTPGLFLLVPGARDPPVPVACGGLPSPVVAPCSQLPLRSPSIT